jgi:hypothetical protein
MTFFNPALDEMIRQKAAALDMDVLFLCAFVKVLAAPLDTVDRAAEQDVVEAIKLAYCRHLVDARREEWSRFDVDLSDEIFASLSKEEDMASDLSFISWDGPVKMVHFKAYMEGSLYTHKIYSRYPSRRFVELLAKDTATEIAMARSLGHTGYPSK